MASKRLKKKRIKKAYNKALDTLKNRIEYYKGQGFNVEIDLPDIPKRITKRDIEKLYEIAEHENIHTLLTLPPDDVAVGEDVVISNLISQLIDRLQQPIDKTRTDTQGKDREAMSSAIQATSRFRDYLMQVIQDEIDNDYYGFAQRLEENWGQIERDIEGLMNGWYSQDVKASVDALLETLRGSKLGFQDMVIMDEMDSFYGGGYEY